MFIFNLPRVHIGLHFKPHLGIQKVLGISESMSKMDCSHVCVPHHVIYFFVVIDHLGGQQHDALVRLALFGDVPHTHIVPVSDNAFAVKIEVLFSQCWLISMCEQSLLLA